MNRIEEIVHREWDMFGNVNNEGGPASCQEDSETFEIMRTSQFKAWTAELQESYLEDLKAAEVNGRNLIMEKYAWMMESTAPERFSEIEKYLPAVSEEAGRIMDEIISIQLTWREEFDMVYPGLGGQARLIHTEADRADDTSFETYLRGELKTYSMRTLILYGRMIAAYADGGRNLTEEIMKETVRCYGYPSLEAAEKRAQER